MPERIERFSVERGFLVRTVVPRRGGMYEHRCPADAYKEIVSAAERFSLEAGDPGFTLEELARAAGTPSTQAAVTLAFLRERGCTFTRLRRNFAATTCLFEDAMIEYHALREKAPDA